MCKIAAIYPGQDRGFDAFLRKALVRLALHIDTPDAMGWCIIGSKQAALHRDGQICRGGRYLLGRAVKFWEIDAGVNLVVQSVCKAVCEPPMVTYSCAGPWGRAVCSDPEALRAVFADVLHTPVRRLS